MIGHQIAQALTEQFYRWELRGRGWLVWPEPVRLEPPFRPFEGHYLPRQLVEDDGQIESLGSKFAKGLGRIFGSSAPPVLEPPPELEEPDADPTEAQADLVELQIALPPDYQPQASVFEQFLFSIGHARHPVAFEVIGMAKELVVQITAGASDAEAVRNQLKAFFPEAVITPADQFLLELMAADDGGGVGLMDFGLEREFMVPINNLKAIATDPLVSLCGALDRLAEGEACVFQVLLEPARSPWATSMIRAVSLGDGKPFFANDTELVGLTRLKVARPLYATVVRTAAVAATPERVLALLKAVAGSLRPLANVQGNQLVPLTNEDYDLEDHLADLLARTSRRTGMLLNSDEVIALAHLPTAAVRAKRLRRAVLRTRAAPDELTKADGILIGENEHEGVVSDIYLPLAQRLDHCHILGGSGSGKSTQLALMAVQDMQQGHGLAVIDPHGDLIETLLPHVPPERLDDVILFDPTDQEFAIAFNPLAAGSSREKELLASDFIAVMRQHTSGWGDQMSSLLGNAVLALLHHPRGGTLPELRRFLADPSFRTEFLKSVTHPEVAYFWESEAQFANKAAVGSILTRLDALLRYESVLHILGQRANKLDFADIMDSGKIFLARLAKGLIGSANAYLLGGLLVSRFYQTAIARQSRRREDRRPFLLMMDEAGELLTPTVAEILTGTRKYGLGLTLAHQSLRQLAGDDEVFGAVTGSCGTKISFQVGSDDARKLAEEFGGFTAADLMGLPKLHALARVGSRDRAFNLKTRFLPSAPRSQEEAYADLLGRTRQRYGTPRAEIATELAALRQFLPKRKAADPFAELSAKQKRERKQREEPAEAVVESDSEDAAAEAQEVVKGEAIKNTLIQAAGGWGFSHRTEQTVPDGGGRIDLVLTRGELVLACEISATTSARHEVANLQKRLRVGCPLIYHLCDHVKRRGQIEALLDGLLSAGDRTKVHCLSTGQFLAHLGELAAANRTPDPAPGDKTELALTQSLTPVEMQAEAQRMLAALAAKLRRKPPSK